MATAPSAQCEQPAPLTGLIAIAGFEVLGASAAGSTGAATLALALLLACVTVACAVRGGCGAAKGGGPAWLAVGWLRMVCAAAGGRAARAPTCQAQRHPTATPLHG